MARGRGVAVRDIMLSVYTNLLSQLSSAFILFILASLSQATS